MIGKLSVLLAKKLVKNGNIQENEQEMYVYGFFMFLSHMFYLFVACIFGIVFNCFIESVIFYVLFQSIRRYAGGYHADTQNRCYVISTAIIAVALLAIRYMSDGSDNKIFILLQSVNFILLYFLVPVDNKNHRLEQWEKEKYGKKARVRIGCMYVLCIFLNFTAIRSIAITVGVTNLTVGGCVIVGKIKNFVLNSLQI